MIWFLLSWVTSAAHAWQFTGALNGAGGGCAGVTWSASTVEFKFGTTYFNSAQEDAIREGLDAWDAGAGTVNRGALFNYTVSSVYSASAGPDNGINELLSAPGPAFADETLAAATIYVDAACSEIVEVDIRYNTDENWYVVLPSVAAAASVSGLSLAAVTAHEAGHGLGLGHETGIEGVMYRRQYAENGSEIRLSEDDYKALTTLHPSSSSSGRNLMLSKMYPGSGVSSDRPVEVGWSTDEANLRWLANVCGTVDVGDGAREVLASVNATGGPYSGVPLEWTLSQNSTCFDGDDITIGTRSPTMATNTPYRVGPAGGVYDIPSSTPDGDYFVCAGINPDRVYSEAQSSFDDNIVMSEGKWAIDCP